MQEEPTNEAPISEEAIMFGHLAMCGVPQQVIQVLFHYGITTIGQLELLNQEIIEKMEITDGPL